MEVEFNDSKGTPLNDGDTIEFRMGAMIRRVKLKWSKSLGVMMLTTENDIVIGWFSSLTVDKVWKV